MALLFPLPPWIACSQQAPWTGRQYPHSNNQKIRIPTKTSPSNLWLPMRTFTARGTILNKPGPLSLPFSTAVSTSSRYPTPQLSRSKPALPSPKVDGTIRPHERLYTAQAPLRSLNVHLLLDRLPPVRMMSDTSQQPLQQQRRHLFKRTVPGGPNVQPPPLWCQRCGRTFPSRNKLMRHIFPSPSFLPCPSAGQPAPLPRLGISFSSFSSAGAPTPDYADLFFQRLQDARSKA